MSPITQGQEGKKMPSRKIVLKKERENRPQLEKQELAQKVYLFWGMSQENKLAFTPCFSREQPAQSLAQTVHCSPVSPCTRYTSPKLKAQPLPWRHPLSLSPPKEREKGTAQISPGALLPLYSWEYSLLSPKRSLKLSLLHSCLSQKAQRANREGKSL